MGREKIALVYAPIWDQCYINLGIASLHAYIKKKNDVEFFDFNINYHKKNTFLKKRLNEMLAMSFFAKQNKKIYSIFDKLFDNKKFISRYSKILAKSDNKIIAFSTYSLNCLFSLKIAEEVNRLNPEKIIIFGGPCCSLTRLGKHIIRYKFVNYVVVGEGENTFSDLINNISNKKFISSMKGILMKENKKIKYNGDATLISDLDKLPTPNFSIFNLESYTEKCLPVAFARGCNYSCSFCNQTRYWRNFRYKSATKIFDDVNEIRKLGFSDFVTHNSLDNGNVKVLNELCDLLIKDNNNFRWHGRMRINDNLTDELILKLKKSGLKTLTFGLESGSPKVLRDMNKNSNIALTERVLRSFHNAGIRVRSTWIVGFPTESFSDFLQSLSFLWRNRKILGGGIPPAYPCSIVHGTDLYVDKKKYGIYSCKGHHFWKSKSNTLFSRIIRLSLFRSLTRIINFFYNNQKRFQKI